ncbi:hypothetical protein GOC35_00595 [Sinorhizobium meliloti]|nr:hypothetical protein [Sinorhizobium meliloti]
MTNAALAWAISHEPTREAYRRSTGESIGPALDRYVAWLRENLIGAAEADEQRGGPESPQPLDNGTASGVANRISFGNGAARSAINARNT